MTLLNIVHLYKHTTAIPEKKKTFISTLNITDTLSKGFKPFEEATKELKPKSGDTFYALVKVSELYSDPTYNRSNRINYGNVVKGLVKFRGFSHKLAGALSGYLRPSGKIVLTKGNHRATKVYAVTQDGDVEVLVEITVHDPLITKEEMIRIESQDHSADCNVRTAQTQEDKFRAAYHAGDETAVNLYNFLSTYRIGISDTNDEAQFSINSYSSLEQARKVCEASCKKYLKAFTDRSCGKEVSGNAVRAGTLFLKYFKNSIHKVSVACGGVDVFGEYMKYVYTKRGRERAFGKGFVLPVDNASITSGNSKIKCQDITIARMISYWNEFCDPEDGYLKGKVPNFDIPANQKNSIGLSSKEFQNFLQGCNIHLKTKVEEIASNKQ